MLVGVSAHPPSPVMHISHSKRKCVCEVVYGRQLWLFNKPKVVPRRGDLQFLNNNESCYTVLIKHWVAFNLVLRVWYFSWLKFKPNHQQQELLSQGSWQIKLQQMALGIDRCVRVRTEQCLFARLRKEAQLGSPIKQEDPPNLSILLSGGKETNKDSLSKGDWSGKSSAWKSSEL